MIRVALVQHASPRFSGRIPRVGRTHTTTYVDGPPEVHGSDASRKVESVQIKHRRVANRRQS